MATNYLTKNIPDIVNDAVSDALGVNASTTQIDTSDIVSLGKALSSFELLDGFYRALANRIVKTVYFVRAYSGNERRVLRDEHDYGAFIQKVYYKMPEAVDSATWEIPTQETSGLSYKQASPYDIETTIGVQSLIYGKKGAWTIEFITPMQQIKDAFLSLSAMNAFLDSMYVVAENAFKLEEERLVSLAVNTSMAKSIDSGKSRNLLAEYNTAHATATLTVAQALESPDFLRYATKEINRTIKNMKTISTAFNTEGYETFTPNDKLVVEMLSEFASASEIYLQSETFHKELVSLPGYNEVPFWQSSGKNFEFAVTSKIDIASTELVTSDNEDGTVSQTGIICSVRDEENVAAYFGNRRQWSLPNPRSEVMNTGIKGEKGFAVDNHANAVVFYIAV